MPGYTLAFSNLIGECFGRPPLFLNTTSESKQRQGKAPGRHTMMGQAVEGASLWNPVQPALLVHAMGSKHLPCWTPSVQRALGGDHAPGLLVGNHHAAICDATC